jgi:hypothetical protein
MVVNISGIWRQWCMSGDNQVITQLGTMTRRVSNICVCMCMQVRMYPISTSNKMYHYTIAVHYQITKLYSNICNGKGRNTARIVNDAI